MAFRADFNFTVAGSPKFKPPDLLNFSLAVEETSFERQLYEPNIGQTLLANARTQNWDFVDRVTRSFGASIFHGDGNAQLIRNALNYSNEVILSDQCYYSLIPQTQ